METDVQLIMISPMDVTVTTTTTVNFKYNSQVCFSTNYDTVLTCDCYFDV